jgi:hypothetical protein
LYFPEQTASGWSLIRSESDKSERFSEIIGGKGHKINAGNNVLVSDIHFYHIFTGTDGFFT